MNASPRIVIAAACAQQATHSDECWHWHLECAERRVVQLERELAAWKRAAESVAAEMSAGGGCLICWGAIAELHKRVAELLADKTT